VISPHLCGLLKQALLKVKLSNLNQRQSMSRIHSQRSLVAVLRLKHLPELLQTDALLYQRVDVLRTCCKQLVVHLVRLLEFASLLQHACSVEYLQSLTPVSKPKNNTQYMVFTLKSITSYRSPSNNEKRKIYMKRVYVINPTVIIVGVSLKLLEASLTSYFRDLVLSDGHPYRDIAR
jgi:hypothetical protein